MKKCVLSFMLIFSLLIPACDMEFDFVEMSNVSAEIKRNIVDDFAVKSQALLGGYEVDSIKYLINNSIHKDLGSFLNSKPSVGLKEIKVHSYSPLFGERSSEYGQIWFKFKTPGSIDSKLSIRKLGQSVTSEKILELAFLEARKIVPEAAALIDELGYVFTFDHENMNTGARWSSSNVKIRLKGSREIYIKTPTLVTGNYIPFLGGMSYCKVLTPYDAAQILVDLANKNHDKIPFDDPEMAPLDLASGNFHMAYDINWYGTVGDYMSQKAILFVDKSYESHGNFVGTFVINPGGFIPAVSMRGLAKRIASMGYIVVIIKYPVNAGFLEFIDFRKSSALNIASIIKESRVKEIQGLPQGIADFYSNAETPISVLGHSHGGASLGEVIFGDRNPYDSIILYGVPSFEKTPFHNKPNAENIALLFGVNDDITTSGNMLKNVRDELLIQHVPDENGIYYSMKGNRTMEMIDGLNHFCIISDLNVGLGLVRGNDGTGPAPSEGIERFINHLVLRGLI